MEGEAGVAPYLAKLSERSWQDFLDSFEAYKGRGGKRQLKALVSPTVLAMLADQGVSDLSDETVIAEVTKIFSPSSISEAYSRLQGLRIGRSQDGTVALEAVLQYNQDWVRAVRLIPEAARPSAHALVSLYVRGLPAVLRDGILLQEPSALEDARRLAVD